MLLTVLGISRCSVTVFGDVILYIGHLILGRNRESLLSRTESLEQGSSYGWVTERSNHWLRTFSWLLLGLNHECIGLP